MSYYDDPQEEDPLEDWTPPPEDDGTGPPPPARKRGKGKADKPLHTDDLDELKKEWLCQDEHQWFERILSVNYARYRHGDRVWCPQWHQHPEVRMRVMALWMAWEVMVNEVTGHSVWWVHHADPQMAMMLSVDGPMQGCTWDEHNPGQVEPLPNQRRTL